MVENEIVPAAVTPVVEAPAQTALQTVTEAPTATVEVAPAPVAQTVETPVSEAPRAPEVAKPAETVLAEALDKPAEAVTESPKVETEVKTEGEKDGSTTEEPAKDGQTEEKAPPPAFDAFTVPEGITLTEDRIKEFTSLLSELELSGKADHKAVQEFGQKAVDFHIGEIKQAVEDVNKYYQTSWDKQKQDWKDSFLKDPEIGGNRFQTTVDSALSFIRTHGGNSEQQAEFRNLMETSGLGNHPVMIRILANAGKAMAEGQPLAATKPVSPPKSKTATLYGKSS